jgi:hypothetical protein
VHLRQVGEAALRERAQQVERRDGLVVGLHHPLRVGDARLGGRLVEWIAWPRNDGSSTPSTVSVGAERGFANWPAIRPTLTTGSVAPYVSTADIWSSTLSARGSRSPRRAERLGAVAGLEQERAPSTASPSARWSARASPAKTSGGSAAGARDGLDRGRVRPLRLLQRGQRAPRGRRPGLGHGHANECSAGRLDAPPTARDSRMPHRPPVALAPGARQPRSTVGG